MENINTHDIYFFEKPEQQALFSKITRELRCSVCQHQSIADSNVVLAVDLRNIIYQKVLESNTEQQILQYVTSRYGEVVLADPPMNWSTSVLWLLPALLIILGFYAIQKLIKFNKKN